MGKTCSICKKQKETSCFYKNRTKKDGLQSLCKDCTKRNDEIRTQNGKENARKRKKYAEMMANPEARIKYRQCRKRWTKASRNKKENSRRYYRKNPFPYKVRSHQRIARERKAGGVFTAIQIRQRFAFYGHRCAYCGNDGKLTIDHVKSLITGGTNWPANIVPACVRCNSAKRERYWIPHLSYAQPVLP